MDNETLLNPEIQRGLKLVALFNSSGWKLFEQELLEDLEAHQSKIDELTRNPVDHHRPDLCELNLAICKRNAVRGILDRVTELKEELGETSPDGA